MKNRIAKSVACLLLMLLGVNICAVADAGIGVVIMPASLLVIEEEAFYGNVSIEKVIVSEGVTEICSKAFANCSNLEVVELPEGLIRIESAAFAGCTELKEINIPASVEFIENDAFDSCPNVVVTVVSGSYAEQWCDENDILTSNGLGENEFPIA